MTWLNYHHLLYFWTVAKHGSVSKAAVELRLAQPTVSSQVRALEDSVGEKLFYRSGRRLVLTEVGQAVFRYADEIFSLGREMMDMLRGNPAGHPVRLVVGITDALPKLIAYRMLAPALGVAEGLRLICREDQPDRLLSQLAIHQLDVVLADAPAPATVRVRAYNHMLGECGVTFFGAAGLARKHGRRFPEGLQGAPFLLPGEGAALRRSLQQWFADRAIAPGVVSEFDDSALMKAFGQAGVGIFAAPSLIEDELCRQFGVRIVGRTEEIRERFYAITVEKRLQNPAVIAISTTNLETHA